ncbi:MAG TPA: class I SAM-dependent methyltransferase [Gemmatimonadaceae bacterium]
MTSVSPNASGTGDGRKDPWSERADDWARLLEPTMRPLQEAVLDRAGVRPGMELLDVGCGSGLLCQFAAARGARVSGLDAASALLEIARRRVPGGAFDAGDIHAMPYEDHTFDVVTGVNFFQFWADCVGALNESKRVAKHGASVIVAIWGRARDCEASAYLAALAALLPASTRGGPGPFALSEPGALESVATTAGLTPVETVNVACEWHFSDVDTALQALLSPAPAVVAVRATSERRVRDAIVESIRPYRTSRGAYQLENEFRVFIARA